MSLFAANLPLHAIELGRRIERGEDDDRFGDLPLRSRPALARDQGVASTERRLVLGLELPQLVLQLGHGLGLHAKLLAVDGRVFLVVPLAAKRLAREVILAGGDGSLRLAAPFLGQLLGLGGVELELLLLRDHGRDLGASHRDAFLHVAQDLIDHLLRVFGAVDQIVDVCPDQPRQPVHHSCHRFPPILLRPA